MAIPRTLGRFPRSGHSRVCQQPKESAVARAVGRVACLATCLAPINKLIQAGGPLPLAWVNGLVPGLLRALQARKLTACMVYRLHLVNR